MQPIGWHLNTFGVARQTTNRVGGLPLRDARMAGGGASLSAGHANLSPREFLRQLLPHVEGGLSLAAAFRRLAVPGARRWLDRLLARIPRAKRQRLTSAGKLRFLLAPRHKERKFLRRTAAAQRRLNRLAPAARLQMLNTYAALRTGGVRGRKAARQAGASVVTLWRWQRRFAQAGVAGLAPRFHRSGRKSGFTVALPAAVLASVRRLNVEKGGNLPAWRAYLASPQCPAEIRTALRGKAIPAALLAATRLTRSKVTLHVGEGVLAVGPLPGPVKFHFLNT